MPARAWELIQIPEHGALLHENDFSVSYHGFYVGEPVVVKHFCLDKFKAADPALNSEAILEQLLRKAAAHAQLNAAAASCGATTLNGYAFQRDSAGCPTALRLLTCLADTAKPLSAALVDERVPLSQRLKWVLQVAVGLNWLHKRGVVHLGLKPNNIMLVPADASAAAGGAGLTDWGAFAPRMTDFGHAAVLAQLGPASSLLPQASLQYMPPELLSADAGPGTAAAAAPSSDVWSLGMLIYAAATRKILPWQGVVPAGANFRTFMEFDVETDDSVRPDLAALAAEPLMSAAKTDGKLAELLRSCWDCEASKRPAVADVVAVLKAVLRDLSKAAQPAAAPPAAGPVPAAASGGNVKPFVCGSKIAACAADADTPDKPAADDPSQAAAPPAALHPSAMFMSGMPLFSAGAVFGGVTVGDSASTAVGGAGGAAGGAGQAQAPMVADTRLFNEAFPLYTLFMGCSKPAGPDAQSEGGATAAAADPAVSSVSFASSVVHVPALAVGSTDAATPAVGGAGAAPSVAAARSTAAFAAAFAGGSVTNIFTSSPMQMPTNPSATAQALDLVFLMDCTASMGPYISACKVKVVEIADKVMESLPGTDVKTAFVGYRDFDHGADNHFTVCDFTDAAAVKRFVEEVQPIGGCDTAEDVAGGIDKVLHLKWRSPSARLVIHFGDCPAHGSAYHDLSAPHTDNYMDIGEELKLEPKLVRLAEKRIDYYFMRLTDQTDKMTAVMKEAYNRPSTANREFTVIKDMAAADPAMFVATVVECVTASISASRSTT